MAAGVDSSNSTRRIDRWLDRFGAAMRDRESRKQAFGKFLKFARVSLAVITLLYLVWLVVALPLLLRHVGERNVTFAFFLFVPLQIWLLPLIPLAGAAVLLFQWRLLLAMAVAVPIFARWPMGYRFGSPELPAITERSASSLTVLSYNRGQHMNQSLQPFKNAVAPDLLIFQETAGNPGRFAKADTYSEFSHAAGEAEYILLSKFPITAQESINIESEVTTVKFPPLAARFVVDWNGTDIAVYAVHLPSPRDVLLYYRRGAFLYGIIGIPGTPFNDKRKINQQFWDNRILRVRRLCERIRNDPLPTIVAGDFNAPQSGYIHGLFDEFLDDSHKTAGSGFGFTFPGTTRNPLSGGGPWMRIDHLMYDPDHWNGVAAVAERNRPSQHRAIAATLEFSEKSE